MPSPPPLEGKKGTARGGLSRRRAISAPAGKKGSAPGGLKPPEGHVRPCREEGRGKEAFSACCGGGKKRCRRLFPCLRPCRRGGTCGMAAEQAFLRMVMEKSARKDARAALRPGCFNTDRKERPQPLPDFSVTQGGRRGEEAGEGRNGGHFRGRAVMDSRGRPQAHPAGVGKGSIVPCTCISA